MLIPAAAAHAVGLLPALATTAAPAEKSNVGLGIRLVDAPTNDKDDPRAQSYIVDHLAPGTIIHRRVEVSNASPDAAQVSVYAAAAAIKAGSFVGAAQGKANDLSSWTSIDPGKISLAPGAKQMATVTISVAKDAAPGEQYAIVWAQSTPPSPRPGTVTQVTRVGIRLYVSVGPGNAPASNFTINTLTAGRTADGRPMISATVHNTGGRAIDLSGSVQLTNGPDGLTSAAFPVNVGTTVAIGGTESTTTILSKTLPAGPWTATITLHSGLLEVTEHATLTFPAAGQAVPVKAVITPAAVASSGTSGWFYLGIIALAIILLAIAVLLTVTVRRRRRQGTA